MANYQQLQTDANATWAYLGTRNTATVTPRPEQQDLPDPVLAAVSPRVVPDRAKVPARIRGIKLKGVGSSYSGSVIEVGSGKVLYAHNATRGYITASTMKLLTSTAALSILGPDHTFKTSAKAANRTAEGVSPM